MTENTAPREDDHSSDVPNEETGVGIGAGQPSTFEPEEDAESVPEDPTE